MRSVHHRPPSRVVLALALLSIAHCASPPTPSADGSPDGLTAVDGGPDSPSSADVLDAPPARDAIDDDAREDAAAPPDTALPDGAATDAAADAPPAGDAVPEPDVAVDAPVPDAPPIDVGCTRERCGLTCRDPVVCGACGNAVCDPGEDPTSCAADCCDAARCDPAMGLHVPAGDARCVGVADGTRCDNGDLADGVETCRRGRCLQEHAHCRCPAGAVDARDTFPRPEAFAAPTIPADPPWMGAAPTEPDFDRMWAPRRVDLSRAWGRSRGREEVRVAVVDTGCDAANADLRGQVVGQRDVVDGDDTAQDDNGHGTSLAALVAGRADGAGVFGVAPGVKLLCVRVAPDTGFATLDHVAAGVRWATAQRAEVILVGVASTGRSAALDAAVRDALAAGSVLVAPSGTGGGASVDLVPAALDGVVSVAASDLHDLPAADTDLSARTLLLAPGEQVLTAGLRGEVFATSGSSVAAALAAGAAALVRSVAPGLTPAQVRALLWGTGAAPRAPGFGRAFAARRIDVGAAVTAASATYVDVAVASLRAPTTALPGEALRTTATVENRGVTTLRDLRVTATTDTGVVAAEGGASGRTATATVASLEPGATRELTFVVTPAAGATAARVDVTGAVAGDGASTNDTARAVVNVAAEVVHALRLARAELTAPSPTETPYALEVEVENAGNVPEPASELRVVSLPGGPVATLAVPSLAAGATTRLRAEVAAPTRPTPDAVAAAWLTPARGQRDLTRNVAAAQYVASPRATRAATAYFQLPGDNLIADAPWRIALGKSLLPLLLFYARVTWLERPLYGVTGFGPMPTGLLMSSVRVRNPTGPRSGAGALIYEDGPWQDAPTAPDAPTILAAARVTDEDGALVPSQKVVPSAVPADGQHRILWLPRTALAGSEETFLEVDFRYWKRRLVLPLPERTRKMLRVDHGPAARAFPAGARGADRWFDAHFHTIAEWFRGENFDFSGPAKAYGGPLEMALATAWSLDYVSGPWPPRAMDHRNELITTDHNTYFDDGDAPEAGPTARARWESGAATGSGEMDRYRTLVGDTAGEEVSLRGEGASMGPGSGFLGRHALLYGARHVKGAWGRLAGFGLACSPAYDQLLLGMARNGGTGCAQALSGIGGFTYAAHPWADNFTWSDAMIDDALALPPTHNLRRYVRREASGATVTDEGFVFSGMQFWNGRAAHSVASSWTTSTLRDINPFPGATSDGGFTWRSWAPNCDAGYRTLQLSGLVRTMTRVQRGLGYTFQDDPPPPAARTRLFRKFYFVGGSDAHGDFNYTLDLAATVVADIATVAGLNTVSDGAWGRPGTYVLGGTLDNMRHGQAVVSDGPLLELEVDGEPRGHWTRAEGLAAWNDDVAALPAWFRAAPERFDPDGQIGGAGRFDGGRTALVPYLTSFSGDTATQYVMVRSRCLADARHGGTTPRRLRLMVTSVEGSAPAVSFVPLTPHPCDGAWSAQRIAFPADLTRSVALLGHAEFGDGCPAQHDVFTNPVWLGVVRGFFPFEIQESADRASFLLLPNWSGQNAFLDFPVSMSPDRVRGRVMQVAADGTLAELTGGADMRGGVVIRNPAVNNGWINSGTAAAPTLHTRIEMTLNPPTPTPVRGRRRAGVTAMEERFVLVLERDDPADRRLRDAFGNPLGVFMVRFRSPAFCARRNCNAGYQFCGSMCNCQQATMCPPGGISLPPCDCCLRYTTTLPPVCFDCRSGTDVFARNCPQG